MPYPDPVSLCTFQPVGAGSPINLGNDDAWVKCESDGVVETYTVNGRYLRNESGDPNSTMTGAMRAAAEVYFKDLVASLNPTTFDIVEGPLGSHFQPRSGSVSGTLANPWSSLSVAGLYLVDFSMEDDGWRGYDFELVFKKAATLAAQTPPTFDPDGVTAAFDLGNVNAYAVISRSAQESVYRIMGAYKGATRADAQNYIHGLAASLNPLEFTQITTPSGSQSMPQSGATKGTLALSATTLSVADVYCTDVQHTDNGNNVVTFILTFKKSLYAVVSNPSTDTRVAKYKTVAIGNVPCTITDDTSDPNFRNIIVRAAYVGTDYATYPSVLADAIGLEPITKIPLPRGDAGNRGVVKSYSATAGALDCDALLAADITNLYAERLSCSLGENNTVAIELLLTKGR